MALSKIYLFIYLFQFQKEIQINFCFFFFFDKKDTFRRLQLSKLTTFSRLLTTSVNNTPLTSEYGRKMLFPGIPRLTEMVMKKANGSYLYSDDGKEYLDFVAGFAVTSTGFFPFFSFLYLFFSFLL